MSLIAGAHVGPYEILAVIGAGGMGEVYRARDKKLNREVALKILPEGFTRDRDRVMRFEREAKTLASLNHPHIAQIGKLQDGSAQVFLTTHSPSTIAAAAKSRFWYVDATGKIGRLDEAKIARHRANDPAAFLSRFAVIAEGKTEVGFVCRLLEKALGGALDQHGIHVSDGGGNESTLDLLEALAEGGVAFGGFADNEGLHPLRWQTLIAAQGGKVFRWAGGCLEDNIVGAVADASLEALAAGAEGRNSTVSWAPWPPRTAMALALARPWSRSWAKSASASRRPPSATCSSARSAKGCATARRGKPAKL
jgi:Protein kinase domain/Overcoming lysogenization defect protein-like, TOPRIM domain